MLEILKSDRRYDEACADHARAFLRAFVEQCGTQERAASKLGLDQGTISRGLAPANQPSQKLLIQLAKVTQTSLDEMLGLKQASSPRERLSDSEIMRMARFTADEIQHRFSAPPPPPLPAADDSDVHTGPKKKP